MREIYIVYLTIEYPMDILILGEYNMQTVVQKWGNSLGIRIPNLFVKDFDLHNGSTVDVSEENGKIVITPKKLTLSALLSEITDENIPETIETGRSLGKEEW